MSLLLKDRVYTMQSPTAKRGVYPLHGYKLGLYRIPIKLDDPAEIKSVFELIQKRETYRKNKQFEEADAVRNTISAMGIYLIDHKDRTLWMKKEKIKADV
mgnify:CR=1 FL=1